MISSSIDALSVLLALGTSSCRAFILSAILSLRSRSAMLWGSVACPRLARTRCLGGAAAPACGCDGVPEAPPPPPPPPPPKPWPGIGDVCWRVVCSILRTWCCGWKCCCCCCWSDPAKLPPKTPPASPPAELAAAFSSACTSSPPGPPVPRESGRSMPLFPPPPPPAGEQPMPWSIMWCPCLRSASCCSTICFTAAASAPPPPGSPLIWCCRSRDASSADSSYSPPNCCGIPSVCAPPSGAFPPVAAADRSGQADGGRLPSIWSRKSSCTPPPALAAARRSSREIWPAAAMACISRAVGCIAR
uniref:Uncharacterized protein n=1 Tax=Arundo donax TaxID=35708 RepID=A0A0A9EYA4_ARUDO